MSRREAVLSALLVFVVALVVRAVFAVADRVPEAGGHGLLRRRRAQPDRGPRPGHRRAVELRDATAGLPATGVRGLAAAADVPRRDPDGDRSGRRFAAAQVVACSSARSCRSSPGGSPPTSPRSAACRTVGRARWPSAPGLTRGGLPAAAPPLGAPRLDDAVRGARARRLPADDARSPATRAARGWPTRGVIGARRPASASPR